MWKPGYVTNGMMDHRLDQAIDLLSTAGYSAIGITLGPAHLDVGETTPGELAEICNRLKTAGLQPGVETGGRYLLHPSRKHWPSLASGSLEGRELRQSCYYQAIDVAVALEAPVVSIWSGSNDDPERDPGEIFDSMISALIPVLDRANECGVKIGFEPEPGMVIESLADWFLMKEKFDHPALGLTVDLGHLGVTESEDPAGSLSAALDDVIHVHIDDCRGGIHEHLPLGEGELNLQKLAAVLSDHGYSGQLLVELSRDSHRAPELVESSMRFLEALGEKRSNPGN